MKWFISRSGGFKLESFQIGGQNSVVIIYNWISQEYSMIFDNSQYKRILITTCWQKIRHLNYNSMA